MTLFETRAGSPLGEIVAWRTDKGLVALGFADTSARLQAPFVRRSSEVGRVDDRSGLIRKALGDYFDGATSALSAIPLDLEGTALQLRIWHHLRGIPAGKTASYRDIAQTLGTSPRVVGNAMAANPVCLVLPCHRVIRSDGTWDGYAYGNHRKRWLLEHEGYRPAKEKRRARTPARRKQASRTAMVVGTGESPKTRQATT